MPKSSAGAGSWQTCWRSVCGRAEIHLSVVFHNSCGGNFRKTTCFKIRDRKGCCQTYGIELNRPALYKTATPSSFLIDHHLWSVYQQWWSKNGELNLLVNFIKINYLLQLAFPTESRLIKYSGLKGQPGIKRQLGLKNSTDSEDMKGSHDSHGSKNRLTVPASGLLAGQYYSYCLAKEPWFWKTLEY